MRGKSTGKAAALEGVTVVEIASELTEYCGKLYADLGAQVLLVEPAGGSSSRGRPPFFDGETGPDRSIPFSYFNAGKKSVAIDLETPEGRRQFRSLVQRADVLVEALPPGRLRQWGLGFETLSADNPSLVVTSITPFGQSGPSAHHQADDLTLMALGGLLALGGYSDGPPTVAYGNQAYLAGAQFAAVASMAALYAAETSGQGQAVDVSIHEAVVLGLENAAQFYQLEGKVRRRIGGTQAGAGNVQFPCKDGYFYLLAGGLASTRFWVSALAWLKDEKVVGSDAFDDPRWQDRAFLNTDEAKDIFFRVFAAFSRTRTKAELFEACRARRIPAAPVATPLEVIGDPQLAHRAFFASPETLRLGRPVIAPGAPYLMSETPCRAGGTAPAIGAHTAAVLTARDHTVDKHRAASPSPPVARPLEGIRVFDLTWVGAGSYTTKILADLGADIIKIESNSKIDDLRLAPPYKDGKPGINRSGYFADRNTGKRSLLLNLKSEAARTIARDLIADCDIIANNFSAGVMERMGLAYDDVRAINPGIVYLSMSARGTSGPAADIIGYGLTLAALAGLHGLSGLPDREPVGTGTHYPDHIPNPCHAVFAVLAALRFRRATGRGQSIDLSQTEPMTALIGPALIDESFNGRVVPRMGNRNGIHAPRGVFPTLGSDRWIALSIRSDAEWRALAAVLGERDLADEAWRSAEGRLAGQDRLDDVIGRATARFDGYALMAMLRARGIAAGVVQTAADLVDRDPQLAHRGHWRWIEHPEMGLSMHNDQPFKFGTVDVSPRSAAPLLGEHTDEICSVLLGYSKDKIERLKNDGVLN